MKKTGSDFRVRPASAESWEMLKVDYKKDDEIDDFEELVKEIKLVKKNEVIDLD